MLQAIFLTYGAAITGLSAFVFSCAGALFEREDSVAASRALKSGIILLSVGFVLAAVSGVV